MRIALGLPAPVKLAMAVCAMLYVVLSETAASADTLPVAGGGVLTMTRTTATRRCEGDLHSFSVISNFSYTLDTVTNPTLAARYDIDSLCFDNQTYTVRLQSGCTIAYTPPSLAVLECHGISGYVGPKYMVIGVTYVPPGPSSFVQYSTSSSFGTTTSLSDSVAVGTSLSVSIGGEVGLPNVLHGTVTETFSVGATQTVSNSSSVAVNIQNLFTTRMGGTPNAFSPVNHDYDLIWLWLNPAALFTVYPTLPGFPSVVTWNGYGVDVSDQPAMDIWPIEVGYLNGHFGPLPFEDASVLSRSWAANQVFIPGQGPGLTSQDFADILRADPFANASYAVTLSTTAVPATTVDGRFTISGASNGNAQSFVYRQPAPGSFPLTQTLTNTYSNTSTLGRTSTHQSQVGFGVDTSLTGGFLAKLTLGLKFSYTITTTHQSGSSVTATTTQIDALSITGPPCGSSTPPCVPVYVGPAQFNVYQDNIFGTFMFHPVN